MGSAVPSRVSLLISILRLNLVLTYSGFPPEFRGGVLIFIQTAMRYAIGSVPSLSGHAIAYRWCSLPRVHRHKASKPRGSSKRALPWQVTMDQLTCASLSHTHCWYEVGMLKVPTMSLPIRFGSFSSSCLLCGCSEGTTRYIYRCIQIVLAKLRLVSTTQCRLFFYCGAHNIHATACGDPN